MDLRDASSPTLAPPIIALMIRLPPEQTATLENYLQNQFVRGLVNEEAMSLHEGGHFSFHFGGSRPNLLSRTEAGASRTIFTILTS